MSEIAKIDKNFDFKTKINRADVVFYDAKKEPFTVYGLVEEDGIFKRMKKSDAQPISEGVLRLHKNTAGGRLRFITNSPYVAIHAKMGYIFKSPNYALTGSAGFDLYEQKENGEYIYKGAFIPPLDSENGYEAEVELWTESYREIVINFPHYSDVDELYIGVKEGSEILKTKGYKHKDPIVFYGSSITQGGCSSRAGTTYTNIVSRELDSDILNLGFSGSAMGETKMAEYIAKLKMTALVIDYDFNAPNEEHLKNTHKPFFDIIRKAQPNLKILILSKPRHNLGPTDLRRKDIIESTYLDAKNNGDDKVAFLSGLDLIPKEFNEIFTVDLCHPNDCGFATMAMAVINKLKELGV